VALTVVDAGVVIGFLNSADAHHDGARLALASMTARGDDLAIPASALAECLVDPIRRGEEELAIAYGMIRQFAIAVVPLDATIAEAAARVRASHGARIRLPDAVVIATAQVLDADVLLTTDHRWPDAPTLGFRGDLVYI
jgi:predicted nucleic acid-binding protein